MYTSLARNGPTRLVRALALVAALLATYSPPTRAQVPGSVGDDHMAWMLSNLRPTGQPVIPIFEGWYEKTDGSRSLCFGYYNLNTEEELEIPLGPDNFVQPARFDGFQPTHFSEVPAEYRRHFCVFTVDVPRDFGDQDVTWTLRVDGRSYSVPGHTTSEHYQIDEPVLVSRGLEAPVLAFVEPRGPEGRGRANHLMAEVNVAAGEPLPLTVALTRPAGGALGRVRVLWDKHRGPGEVTFDRPDMQLQEILPRREVSTAATLTTPGEYVLRVQAVDWTRGNPFGFQCCWTNGFVRVTVRAP